MKTLMNIMYAPFALVALSAAVLLGLAQPGSAQSSAAPHEKSPLLSSVSSPTTSPSVFVVANLDDKVTRINARPPFHLSTVATLAGNANPIRIAKNPAFPRAYVCKCGDGTVYVFNTNNGEMVTANPNRSRFGRGTFV